MDKPPNSEPSAAQPRTARARMKELADIAPHLVCCDVMRKSVAKHAGIIFEIYPERRIRDRRKCDGCQTEHEINGIQMAEIISNCGVVAVEFIDIDEAGE